MPHYEAVFADTGYMERGANGSAAQTAALQTLNSRIAAKYRDGYVLDSLHSGVQQALDPSGRHLHNLYYHAVLKKGPAMSAVLEYHQPLSDFQL